MLPGMMRLFYELDKILNANFDPLTKMDACKMLVLMFKASRNTELAILPFVPPYFVAVAISFMTTNGLAIVLTLATGIAFIYFLEQKRKEALINLKKLMRSDPAYWEPIREKLREAISQK